MNFRKERACRMSSASARTSSGRRGFAGGAVAAAAVAPAVCVAVGEPVPSAGTEVAPVAADGVAADAVAALAGAPALEVGALEAVLEGAAAGLASTGQVVWGALADSEALLDVACGSDLLCGADECCGADGRCGSSALAVFASATSARSGAR